MNPTPAELRAEQILKTAGAWPEHAASLRHWYRENGYRNERSEMGHPVVVSETSEEEMMEIRNETGEDVEVGVEEDRSVGPVRVETPQSTPQPTPQKGTRNTRSARGLANLPVPLPLFEYFLGAATDLRVPVEKVVELVAEDFERLLRGELAIRVGVDEMRAEWQVIPSLDERVTMEFARRVEERRKQRGGGHRASPRCRGGGRATPSASSGSGGGTVMAEHEASHEAQYPDDPTWCKHCGEFREYWTGPCPKPGSREFDESTKEGRRRIGALILGGG